MSVAKVKTRQKTGNIAIRASAGSGKTYALTVQYLSLLHQDIAPARILATTFTRKAAREILGRVLKRLAEAVLVDEKCAALAADLNDKRFTKKRAQQLLNRLIDSIDDIRIGTMDSFFAAIARRHALNLGLPPRWEIADSVAEKALRHEALAELYEDMGPKPLAQLSRWLSRGTVDRSVHDQLDSLIVQLHELYLETNEDAWRRLPRTPLLTNEQLESLLDEISACEIPWSKMRKARDQDVERARAGLWKDLVGKGLALKVASGETVFDSKDIPCDLLGLYTRLIEHAKGVFRQRYADQTEGTYRALAMFDRFYRETQFRSGQYRFGDITRALGAYVRGNNGPSLEPRIDQLLVDEFQDTSLTQWDVIRPFAKRANGESEGSFFCVGDPKQAIYRWRGGMSELFDAIFDEIVPLELRSQAKSHRSSQIVLDAVNEVFEAIDENAVLSKHQSAAIHWKRNFERHEAQKTLPGHVTIRTGNALDDEGDKKSAHMEWAATEIERFHQEAPDATIGVLVRDNAAVATLLYELRQRHLPVSEERGNPLSKSPAVSLILSLLWWLDHPGSSADFFHVTHSVLGERLGLKEDSSPLDQRQFAQRWRNRLLYRGYAHSIAELVDLLRPGLPAASQNRLDQLVELAVRYEPVATSRPSNFVRYIEETSVEDPAASHIRVMTIHQAKGLEFDIVVLPQLECDMAGQPPAIVCQRSNATGPVVGVCRYINEKERALMPPEIQQMFPQHEQAEVIENLCNLYVSMTRAIHALHILLRPSKHNERTVPCKMSGVVRATFVGMVPLEPNQLLHERGDQHWYRSLKVEPKERLEEVLDVSWKPSAASGSLSLRTPSQHFSNRLTDRLTLPNTDVVDRGDVIHRWMSMVEWLDAGQPSDKERLEAARSVFPARSNFDEMLAEYHRMLAHEAVRTELSRESLSTEDIDLWRERAIWVPCDGKLICGKVDRAVIFRKEGRPSRAVILDFKTDRVKSGRGVEVRAKVYADQMDLYRTAIARMLRLERTAVEARLVFLDIGVVVPVS